jgi:hypothetical protein
MEMRGDFDPLKAAIAKSNPDYAQHRVAFKPNEHVEGLEEFKPISVLEVLQLIMAMDIGHYDANEHPVDAYKYRATASNYYRQREAEYRKIFPIIGDILQLFDRLRLVVPEAYNSANARPKYWTKVLAGPGQPVDNRLVEPLYYIDPTGETKAPKSPNGLFFPMFSAFRAALRENKGNYDWCDGKGPSRWPEADFQEACRRLSLKVAKAAKEKDSAHIVGRDPQVWATCYETLNSFLFEYNLKRRV